MSDRPTPETDAACGYALTSHYGRGDGSYLQMDKSGPFVHTEVARKLERERDEAREDLEFRRGLYKVQESQLNDARERLKEIQTFESIRNSELRAAIIATLEENRHLADGDDCTLSKLKSAVPDWK